MVPLGRIGRPHGVRGEVRAWPYNPGTTSLKKGATLRVGRVADKTEPLQVEALRRDAKGVIIRFAGQTSRDAVEPLNGAEWFAARADFAPLADDEVYVVDLVGAQVTTVDGEHVGQLVDVLQVGPSDLLVIKDGGREVMVPNVEAFVERLDAAAGQVVIRPIPGLLGE